MSLAPFKPSFFPCFGNRPSALAQRGWGHARAIYLVKGDQTVWELSIYATEYGQLWADPGSVSKLAVVGDGAKYAGAFSAGDCVRLRSDGRERPMNLHLGQNLIGRRPNSPAPSCKTFHPYLKSQLVPFQRGSDESQHIRAPTILRAKGVLIGTSEHQAERLHQLGTTAQPLVPFTVLAAE